MQDCRAVACFEEQVFRPAFERLYGLPGERFFKMIGYGPSQTPFPNDNFLNSLLLEPGGDASAAGFYFGKLWHWSGPD
jgi:hypothetical protein